MINQILKGRECEKYFSKSDFCLINVLKDTLKIDAKCSFD